MLNLELTVRRRLIFAKVRLIKMAFLFISCYFSWLVSAVVDQTMRTLIFVDGSLLHLYFLYITFEFKKTTQLDTLVI